MKSLKNKKGYLLMEVLLWGSITTSVLAILFSVYVNHLKLISYEKKVSDAYTTLMLVDTFINEDIKKANGKLELGDNTLLINGGSYEVREDGLYRIKDSSEKRIGEGIFSFSEEVKGNSRILVMHFFKGDCAFVKKYKTDYIKPLSPKRWQEPPVALEAPSVMLVANEYRTAFDITFPGGITPDKIEYQVDDGPIMNEISMCVPVPGDHLVRVRYLYDGEYSYWSEVYAQCLPEPRAFEGYVMYIEDDRVYATGPPSSYHIMFVTNNGILKYGNPNDDKSFKLPVYQFRNGQWVFCMMTDNLVYRDLNIHCSTIDIYDSDKKTPIFCATMNH